MDKHKVAHFYGTITKNPETNQEIKKRYTEWFNPDPEYKYVISNKGLG